MVVLRAARERGWLILGYPPPPPPPSHCLAPAARLKMGKHRRQGKVRRCENGERGTRHREKKREDPSSFLSDNSKLQLVVSHLTPQR